MWKVSFTNFRTSLFIIIRTTLCIIMVMSAVKSQSTGLGIAAVLINMIEITFED